MFITDKTLETASQFICKDCLQYGVQKKAMLEGEGHGNFNKKSSSKAEGLMPRLKKSCTEYLLPLDIFI